MTISLASADELDNPTTGDLKPAQVFRKDMWASTSQPFAGRTAMEGPGAWPPHDYSLGTVPRSPWWQQLGLRIARIIHGVGDALRRSEQRRLMRLLDDRTLADMGLVRSEIEHAVRDGHPRWRRQTPAVTNRR